MQTDLVLSPRNIFSDSGVEWKNYRYFDPKTIGLDFKGMTEDLESAPDGSVVVLHGEHLLWLVTSYLRFCEPWSVW